MHLQASSFRAQITEMKQNYEAGGYGYGHAKQALFELVCERFSEQRERYTYYMSNLEEVDQALAVGREKSGCRSRWLSWHVFEKK